jgi:hypothetical protein
MQKILQLLRLRCFIPWQMTYGLSMPGSHMQETKLHVRILKTIMYRGKDCNVGIEKHITVSRWHLRFKPYFGFDVSLNVAQLSNHVASFGSRAVSSKANFTSAALKKGHWVLNMSDIATQTHTYTHMRTTLPCFQWWSFRGWTRTA